MAVVIKRRNLLLQVLWMFLTFGLYAIYWFYATSKEMDEYLGKDDNILLWTIFFGFPILFFYSYYKQGELYELISNRDLNRWVIFALWVIFPPAVWIIVQNKLNHLAEQQQKPTA